MRGSYLFLCRRNLVLVGVLSLSWFAGCFHEVASRPILDQAEPPHRSTELSPEVRSVLDKKLRLVEQLATQDRILVAVRQANDENSGLTASEIDERDLRWRASEGIDAFIKPFLTNECADALIEFQEDHDAFPELLVTDARGLIVAASNKCSDYLQADERWWTETVRGGRGRSHIGSIEYDDSARSEAISVYAPILDPETGQAIGAIKAVCDVTAIKLEL